MATTSIRGRFVFGFDGNDHCLIPDGEFVYRGNTIVYVGPPYSGDLAPADHAADAYRAAFEDPSCLKMVHDWRTLS